MLRSASTSGPVRLVGYAAAAACAIVFAYLLRVVYLVASDAGDGRLWVWAVLWTITPLALTIGIAIYVARQPGTDGYAFVGGACLAGAFMCCVALFPFVIF